MEDDYGSNVHAGLEKSVRFRVSALERFCYKGFPRNLSGTKYFVRLREVSTLKDIRFRVVPLYSNFILLGDFNSCMENSPMKTFGGNYKLRNLRKSQHVLKIQRILLVLI